MRRSHVIRGRAPILSMSKAMPYTQGMTRAALNPQLKQVVATGTPVELFDPTTNEVYYLVSADQFQNLSGRAGSDLDPRIAYPLIDAIMADDDAGDPLLDSYQ